MRRRENRKFDCHEDDENLRFFFVRVERPDLLVVVVDFVVEVELDFRSSPTTLLPARYLGIPWGKSPQFTIQPLRRHLTLGWSGTMHK
jgi:hypothetical protein